MKKADKSTKDAILGKNPITLDTYEVVYQKISDHKMVIANISVWEKEIFKLFVGLFEIIYWNKMVECKRDRKSVV